MPSTPLASKSSTIRFCAAAVPSPSWNSTVTSGNSTSAFSVPLRAIDQKSLGVLVMNASLRVVDASRVHPVTVSAAAQISVANIFNLIRFSSRNSRHAGSAALQDLIAHHAHENDGSHHSEVERARNAEQVHEVLEYLQQGRPEQDSDHRSLAAAQAAAAEH